MNLGRAAAMHLFKNFALLAKMIEHHPEWLWLRQWYASKQ
jgi:pterin-4a-carbinolamine dehydratase